MMRFVPFVVAAISLSAAAPALADDGAQVFNTCKTCHTAKSTALAPTLNGVVGRKAGSLPDFKYSAALQAKGKGGLVWTKDNLDKFLAKPSALVPGTRMVISVPDEKRREALIGYLKTLK
jgi:cytochrome c